MKKSIYLIFFIVFIFNTASHSQWQKVNTLYGGNCTQLIVDSDLMYSFLGNIYYSKDKGLSWDTCKTGSDTMAYPNNIRSVSVSNGLLVACGFNYIMFSIDTGSTWIRRPNSFAFSSQNLEVLNGIIYGTIGHDIYTSLDTGTTWQIKYSDSGSYFKLQKIDDEIFVFYNNSPIILRALNSGSSWDSLNTNASVGVPYTIAKKADTLVAISTLNLYLSTDFGLTWQMKSLPSLSILYKLPQVYFIDTTLIITLEDQIYKSTNLGDSWALLLHEKGLYASNFVQLDSEVFVSSTYLAVEKINILNGQTEDKNHGISHVVLKHITNYGDSIYVLNNSAISIVYYSYNNGLTWGHFAPINQQADAITTDAVGNIYMTFRLLKKIFRSTDGAKTWSVFGTYPVANYMSTNNLKVQDTTLYCATRFGIYSLSTLTGGIATTIASNFYHYTDLAIFGDTIIAITRYSITKTANTPPYTFSSDMDGINANKNFTNITTNDISVLATSNTGVYRRYPPSTFWTRIGMYNKAPRHIISNTRGDAFIICSKGIATLYKDANKWNIINYGLPSSFNWSMYKEIAANTNNLYLIVSGDGLWRRPMNQIIATGINDPQPQSDLIDAYPNPANTDVTVSLNASANQNYTLNIFDITGRNCYSEKFTATSNSEKNIDLRFLENGCYVFQFQNGSTVINKKIIVQH